MITEVSLPPVTLCLSTKFTRLNPKGTRRLNYTHCLHSMHQTKEMLWASFWYRMPARCISEKLLMLMLNPHSLLTETINLIERDLKTWDSSVKWLNRWKKLHLKNWWSIWEVSNNSLLNWCVEKLKQKIRKRWQALLLKVLHILKKKKNKNHH